jgi:hypothetical protein
MDCFQFQNFGRRGKARGKLVLLEFMIFYNLNSNKAFTAYCRNSKEKFLCLTPPLGACVISRLAIWHSQKKKNEFDEEGRLHNHN